MYGGLQDQLNSGAQQLNSGAPTAQLMEADKPRCFGLQECAVSAPAMLD